MQRHRILGMWMLIGGVVSGCSAAGSAGDDDDRKGTGAGPGQGGFDGSGGADATVGSGSGTGGGGLETCASATEVARPVEANMFISFDKSGSMDSDDKWPEATAALKQFFADPGTDQLRVALRFFGDDLPGGEGCSQFICNLAACAVPHVDVDYLSAAPGDPHEQALIGAINARAPGGNGGTPIHPALHGATTWARNYKIAHPSDEVVVLLVTDGAPQGCNESVSAIAALASDAWMNDGIRTYTVGLAGSHEGTMNQIAAAGGTNQSFFIDGGDVTAELLAALQQIQGEATLPCQFAMPTGDNVDTSKVNMTFTPGGGGEQTIGQVADAAACSGVVDGWYYDDPLNPTSLTLCPDTCAAVQGDPAGIIDIVVGCETVVATPK